VIYVDELRHYPKSMISRAAQKYGQYWCHMFHSDGESVAGTTELMKLAAKIKLQDEWLQMRPGFIHYDLTPSMRAKAIKAGAVEIRIADWFRERKNKCQK